MTATQLFRKTLTSKALVSRTLFAGIAAVALTAAGFGFAQGFSSDGSAIAKGGARWIDAFGTADTPHLTPSARETKGDRLGQTPACDKQDWPFLAEECLVPASGTEFRTATRTITIEHRDEANRTSTLVRMPVQEIALR